MASLQTNQILVAALAVGLLSFAGVASFLVATEKVIPPPQATDISRIRADILLLGVMAIMTVVCTVCGVVLAGMIRSQLRKKAESGTEFDGHRLLAQFQTITILRAALAEGPALLGAVIVLTTGNWWGLAGCGFGLVMLSLVVFPTRGRFEAFEQVVTGRPQGW